MIPVLLLDDINSTPIHSSKRVELIITLHLWYRVSTVALVRKFLPKGFDKARADAQLKSSNGDFGCR